MNSSEVLIREYVQGDETDIIKLHREIFHSDTNIEKWKWQFMESPQGKAWITVADKDSAIVGHYALMRSHLNFLGTEIVAGQGVDGMVREDQRGKKLVPRCTKKTWDCASKDGLQAVFGFPNHAAYPGLRLHVIRLFRLKQYRYRFGFKKIIGGELDSLIKFFYLLTQKMKINLFKITRQLNISIHTSDKLQDNLDIFLHDIRLHEVLSLWKDQKYLKWRYEDHPTNKYLFHSLLINNNLEGLIITRSRGDSIAICEVFSRKKNVIQMVLFLHYIILQNIRSNAQIIEFYGCDDGFFDAIFQQAGFKKSYSDLIATGTVFDNEKLREVFRLPHNWTILYGDTDVI